MKEVNHYI